MKKYALALGLAGLGVLQQVTSAQALDFNGSFVTDSNSTVAAGQTISGTISGLESGSNNGYGLKITAINPSTKPVLATDNKYIRNSDPKSNTNYAPVLATDNKYIRKFSRKVANFIIQPATATPVPLLKI